MAEETKKAEGQNQEEKVVDLRDRVTVYTTKKHPDYAKGVREVSISPLIKDKLISNGYVTEKPEKEKA